MTKHSVKEQFDKFDVSVISETLEKLRKEQEEKNGFYEELSRRLDKVEMKIEQILAELYGQET